MHFFFVEKNRMELIEFLSEISNYRVKIGITGVLILGYLIYNKISSRLIYRYGKRHGISLSRVAYTRKYFTFVAGVVFLLLLGITWDISFEGLSFYFISFFTVAGIALFAAWSILSNITAAILLFFYFPIRIGNRIKIMDGDNSVEGMVFDLTLFSVVIKNDEGQKIIYPNNLALQKGIVLIAEK